MLSPRSTLQKICGSFKAPIKYGFGYGSGVFSQGKTSESKKRQIDMIFGVENPQEWHYQNMQQNPHHYSGMKYLGSSAVAWTQEKLGAGVYFNPFVQIDNHQVKYGVVDLKTLRDDLHNWSTLYLAGRMHKPVKLIIDHPEISAAQKVNLKSAMSTALLLLPTKFSEFELYQKIAAVSYMGDVRMAFAENPQKVQNIVKNQFADFRRLYSPHFDKVGIFSEVDELPGIGPESKGLPLQQGSQNEEQLLLNLPQRFRDMITKDGSKQVKRLRVSNAVARIVKYPSLTQSIKGVLTAGILRSTKYMVAKLGKRFAT